jgi:polar amino acid transport system substrate-binding protein
VQLGNARFCWRCPGVRLLIEQAMGTPKGRPAAARYVHGFVEDMKASGFVAEALKRSNQPSAQVAPPAQN